MIRRRNLFCYAMVAPALLLVLVIGVYPMLDSIRLAFLQYDLLRIPAEGTPFVGLANFGAIFSEPRFIQTLQTTFLFTILAVSGNLCLALTISTVLNQDFRGRGTLRTIVLVPWVTPPVVAAAVWLWLYEPGRSPLNQVLSQLGLIERNIGFLTDTATYWGPLSIPLLSVTLVRIWFGLPFAVIMLLAGLQSIPRDLYEAAELDGASVFTRFRTITIPLLKPVLTILLALLVIGGLGHFDINYVMTGGGPNNMTNTLAVIAYQEAFNSFRFDYAAAISVVILIFTSMIAVFYIWRRFKELQEI